MKKLVETISFTLVLTSVLVLDVAHATYYGRDAFFPGNGLPDSSIGALVYWEEGNVSSWGYAGYSLDARTEFDQITDAVINFRRATSTEINSAQLRYFAEYTPEYSWYGHTYNYDAKGNPLDSKVAGNYAWSKVDLWFNDYKIKFEGLNANETRRVAVHELGHVLSMVHQPIGYNHLPSVMQEHYKGNPYWNLSSIDVSNLQFMY